MSWHSALPVAWVVVAAHFIGTDVPLDCLITVLVDGLGSSECPRFVDNGDIVGSLTADLWFVES